MFAIAIGLPASSLSLNFTSWVDQALTLVNTLGPIFFIALGVFVGFALLAWVISEIRKTVIK